MISIYINGSGLGLRIDGRMVGNLTHPPTFYFTDNRPPALLY
jgi:hypothetical protein